MTQPVIPVYPVHLQIVVPRHLRKVDLNFQRWLVFFTTVVCVRLTLKSIMVACCFLLQALHFFSSPLLCHFICYV